MLSGIDENGNEYKLESEIKGSYAEYKGSPEYESFRLTDDKLLSRMKAAFSFNN